MDIQWKTNQDRYCIVYQVFAFQWDKWFVNCQGDALIQLLKSSSNVCTYVNEICLYVMIYCIHCYKVTYTYSAT